MCRTRSAEVYQRGITIESQPSELRKMTQLKCIKGESRLNPSGQAWGPARAEVYQRGITIESQLVSAFEVADVKCIKGESRLNPSYDRRNP